MSNPRRITSNTPSSARLIGFLIGMLLCDWVSDFHFDYIIPKSYMTLYRASYYVFRSLRHTIVCFAVCFVVAERHTIA